MIESTLALTVLDVFEPYLATIWHEFQFGSEERDGTTLRDTLCSLREAAAAERESFPTLQDLRVGLVSEGGHVGKNGVLPWLETPPAKRIKRLSRTAAAAAAAAATGSSPAPTGSPSAPSKGKRNRAASTANMVCAIQTKVCPCGTETTAPRVTCTYLTAEDPFTLPLQQLSTYQLSFRAAAPPPLVLSSVFFDAAIASLMEAFLVSGSIFEVLQWCLLCKPDSFASLNSRLERDYATAMGNGVVSSPTSTLQTNLAKAQLGQQLVKILNLFPKDALASLVQKLELADRKEGDASLSTSHQEAKSAAFFTFTQWFIRTVALRCFAEVAMPLFLSDQKKSGSEGWATATETGEGGARPCHDEGRALLFADIEPNVRTRPVFQRAAARGGGGGRGGDQAAAPGNTECRVTVQWPTDASAVVKREHVEHEERAAGRPAPAPQRNCRDGGVASGAHFLHSHGPLLFTPYSVDELEVVTACVEKLLTFADHHLRPKRRPSERDGRSSAASLRVTVPQAKLFREVRERQRTEERAVAETTPRPLLSHSATTIEKNDHHPHAAAPSTWGLPLHLPQSGKDGDGSDVDEEDDDLSVCWLAYNRAETPGGEHSADDGRGPMPLLEETDGLRFVDIVDPACVAASHEAGSAEALAEVGEVLAIADKVFSGRTTVSDRSWGSGRNRVPVISCSTILLNRSVAEAQDSSEPRPQQPTAVPTAAPCAGDSEVRDGAEEGLGKVKAEPPPLLEPSAHAHVLGLYHHESGVFYNTQMDAFAMDVTAKERW